MLFNESLAQLQPRPVAQLEVIVEMIVGRISSDFTSLRFRECYQDFMRGLEWTPESSLDDIGQRYARAYSDYYAPFMSQHDYMLEHYLVNYAHSRLFPFGPQETSQNLSAEKVVNTIGKQYMLMAVNYAVVKAVLIGLAGFEKAEFGAAHVIKGVQSCAKTFEHSVAFPGVRAQDFGRAWTADVREHGDPAAELIAPQVPWTCGAYRRSADAENPKAPVPHGRGSERDLVPSRDRKGSVILFSGPRGPRRYQRSGASILRNLVEHASLAVAVR